MAINRYNLKKWYEMLAGKSVSHVNQDKGKYYSTQTVKGYYNNLTEKVTMQPDLLGTNNLPLISDEKGGMCEFPVAIFQYGLGAYDLYLAKKDTIYKEKFRQCCLWALIHQEENGAWSNFHMFFPENPYGAMCQGEGVSLLIRGYIEYGDNKYMVGAQKALDFMLKSVEEGGTTLYDNNDVCFLEYTHKPIVLNGWIFAWWGLYDYVKYTGDNGYYSKIMEKSCDTLRCYLPMFSLKYWSKYRIGKELTSPFYHRLHIAQMQAMFDITNIVDFENYADLWSKQLKNPIFKGFAFAVKSYQKIME